jgi:gas vesicle protein
MNSFVKGVLVGVGVGLLVAPMRGEEMRQLLAERFEELRSNLPENPQVNQYTQDIANRVSQTANNLKGLAQQASSTVQNAGSQLGDIAQQATQNVKSTSKDVASTTKQAVTTATSNTGQNAQPATQTGAGTGTGTGSATTTGPATGTPPTPGTATPGTGPNTRTQRPQP